jgi:1-acyl-sn-glycerol-3-phosphate acyltransferase
MTMAAEIIRSKGISVLVFPEGGRSHNGVLQEFNDGAAYIGIKARVPIVPISLVGTRAVLPFGSGSIRPGQVTLRIGRPIDTSTLSLRHRAAVTAELRRQILAGIERGPAPG